MSRRTMSPTSVRPVQRLSQFVEWALATRNQNLSELSPPAALLQ